MSDRNNSGLPPGSDMSAYIGTPPKASVETEVHKQWRERTAMSQPAQRVVYNLEYYEKAFAKLVARHDSEFYRLAKEFHDSKAWKDRYPDWRTARQLILQISADAYHKGISRILATDDKGILVGTSQKS